MRARARRQLRRHRAGMAVGVFTTQPGRHAMNQPRVFDLSVGVRRDLCSPEQWQVCTQRAATDRDGPRRAAVSVVHALAGPARARLSGLTSEPCAPATLSVDSLREEWTWCWPDSC
ncbi:MAG: hypothetical protein Kow0073_16600 [Immundisolibacter sp.]